LRAREFHVGGGERLPDLTGGMVWPKEGRIKRTGRREKGCAPTIRKPSCEEGERPALRDKMQKPEFLVLGSAGRR